MRAQNNQGLQRCRSSAEAALKCTTHLLQRWKIVCSGGLNPGARRPPYTFGLLATHYIPWRYSRARESGVTRCPDDWGPGVSNVTPDFRVQEIGKREDGRMRAAEESDAADFQTAEPTVTENGNQEEPKKSAGTTDGSRNTGDTKIQEPTEETLRSRHIPGGAWLTKVRSFLRDSQFLKREKGGRRGEGRDGEKGVGEGSCWEEGREVRSQGGIEV
ncbi:hypothetical protein NDU88_007554 [Pleurodeles waltl]|uniref:Uncharacterized protein n=1 Tax=Pleurodeles waltl TaxID=8319 RepID=A0AAV7PRT2_PLEWA|nr:hypothetical protein NDU88_007554 [Pleurodeles waltl]